jgi:hypothetical protein
LKKHRARRHPGSHYGKSQGGNMNDLIAIQKFKGDEEALVNDIIKSRGANLPDKIDDVINIFEFTDFKAKAWKMLSDKMKNIEAQADLYQSAQRSAQKWSISALYAQKRMGELTKDIDPEKNQRIVNQKTDINGTVHIRQHIVQNKDGPKAGIPTATWRDAERIAKHPEILDSVIENAVKSDTIDIPTKAAVLNRIRIEAQREVNERAKRKGDAKIVNDTTTATKDYYDSLKGFEESIKTALLNAQVGKFAPEGKNFMIKKHDKIRQLLKQLEEALNV